MNETERLASRHATIDLVGMSVYRGQIYLAW